MELEELFYAHLNGIVHDEELACDEIWQKAFLEVNEEGVEAAAGKYQLALISVVHYSLTSLRFDLCHNLIYFSSYN